MKLRPSTLCQIAGIALQLNNQQDKQTSTALTCTLGEETTEVADLTYHTLVLLAARGLKLQDVLVELEKRHNPTGVHNT